jgi:hypothetical protein
MDEQDIIDLLELQRLTRELLDHLTAMFPAGGGGGVTTSEGGLARKSHAYNGSV